MTHRHQTARTSALITAVANQGSIDITHLQQDRGINGVGEKRRATGAIIVGKARANAEVFRRRQARQGVVTSAHKQTVNIT